MAPYDPLEHASPATRQQAREAKMRQEQRSKRLGLLLGFFCFSLFMLAIGIIVVFLINPIALQTRLTGIQTTGLVTATGQSDRCQYFTYTFVDSHNQVQQITNPSMCESGFQSVGDHVTIWYPQDHPSQMITANDLIFDLIFLLGFSSPMILLIAFCVVSFVRGSMKQRRQRKQGDTEDVFRP